MKRAYISFILVLAPIVLLAQAPSREGVPQLGKSSIKAVIAAMTLQEKASMVTGMGFSLPRNFRRPANDSIGGRRLPPSDPQANSIPPKVPGAAGRTHAIPR
ncbi:MAG TPA: hypothetical protein VMV20_07110, partial [Chitinophagaceae bacterium]|nr:hypothetical protein [Chitinophagaceae bacterium]